MLTKIFKGLTVLFKQSKNTNPGELSKLDKSLSLIDKLNISKFNNFNNNENSTLVIKTIYKRLPLYNNKLKEIINHISSNKAVYNQWCTEQLLTIKTNDFFLSEKDYYIDEVKTLEEFKNLSVVFLCIYYEKDDSVGIVEHNKRVLTNFTEHLITTIEELVLISNS